MHVDGRRTPTSRIAASTAAAVALALGVAAAAASARPAGTRGPNESATEPADSAAAVHLLRRATFGVRPEDIADVLALGRTGWLDRQLHPEQIENGALEARLNLYPLTRASMFELFRDFTPDRPRPAPGDSMMAPGTPAPERMTPEQSQAMAVRAPARILSEMVGARLTRAVHSERQLEEVMSDFWFNHFNVFFNKGLDRYLVADYERTAIRPYVFGRFEDMVRATAQHPAMLFYLDNWTSVVPDSANETLARLRRRNPRVAPPNPAGGRERGINENYARELMELHTLGVDGGYSQADVVDVARALTGWSFQPLQRPGAAARPERLAGGALGRRAGVAAPTDDVPFVFRPVMHDRGEKVVLGHTLAAGRGIEDGLDVIHILSTHPATARFIATKLIERFVTDMPSDAMVDDLAAVFTRTGGDLREVTRALFTADWFYDSANVGTKIKTPFELVASALRVTHADVGPSRRLMETLRSLGQLPYTEAAPTGFPATSEDWVNAGAMLARMNFGLAVGSGQMQGVRIDGARLLGATPGARTADGDRLGRLLAMLMPGVDTRKLEAKIRADLSAQATPSDADRAGAAGRRRGAAGAGARALGLALGSPEFQRR